MNRVLNKISRYTILQNTFKVIFSVLLCWSYFEFFINKEPIIFILCIFYISFFLFMLWVPKSWWNSSKYIFISSLLIGTVLIIHVLGMNVYGNVLLWPLVCLLAIAPNKFILTTALQALVAIIVVLWISRLTIFSYAPLLGLGGLYIGIRALSLLNEAYKTNQKQLVRLEKVHEELKTAHLELQEATLHSMQYAALTERTRIAREIHDGLGHQMTSLIVQLQALQFMLPKDPQTATQTVEKILNIARSGMQEIRVAVNEWTNDEKGLGIIAIRGFISQTDMNSTIHFNFIERSEFSDWSREVCIAIFRVLQESITNVLRHSNARDVEICIEENQHELFLVVSDNGQFTHEDSLHHGFGIKGMKERCRSVGGTCTFSKNEHGGLKMMAIFPLTNHES